MVLRIVTGDECGFLKECIPSRVKTKDTLSSNGLPLVGISKDDEGGVRIINSSERPSRRRGVVDLTWTTTSQPSQSQHPHPRGFAALRLDGTVQIWERRRDSSASAKSFGNYQMTCEAVHNVFGDEHATTTSRHMGDPMIIKEVLSPLSRPIGISALHRQEEGDNTHTAAHSTTGTLVACNAQGKVSILSIDQEASNLSVLKQFSTFDPPCTSAASTTDNYPLVGCMAVHPTYKYIAVGGKDRETTLFDIESSRQVWKAKNVPPHPQTLLQPMVWPTSILFLRNDVHLHSCAHGSTRMAVGSDRQVRLYDLRADADAVQRRRRPVALTPAGALPRRITSMCQTSEHHLVVADTIGTLLTLDLRNLQPPQKPQKPQPQQETTVTVTTQSRRYVGPAGSIRQLALHPTLPRMMAAVGLDRMLRLYDTTHRKQVMCMYLKQRLNCVLMITSDSDVTHDDDDADENLLRTGRSDQEDDVCDYVDSEQEEYSNDDEEESGQEFSDVESSDSTGCSQDSSERDEESDIDNLDVPRKRQRN